LGCSTGQFYIDPPQWRGKKHNLGDLEIEECKLECKNSGDPPFVGGEGPENWRQKAQQKETGHGKCKCTPPLLLGGGLELLCELHLDIWVPGNHSLNQNNLKLPLRGRNLSCELCQLFLETPPSGGYLLNLLVILDSPFGKNVFFGKSLIIEICLCAFTCEKTNIKNMSV